MSKINLAIVGLGNCASSLIQGIGYYSDENTKDGLITESVGKYKAKDINVVAAFEVNINKIGKKISQAILELPNCTKIFYNNQNLFTDIVSEGPVLDGITQKLSQIVPTKNDNKNLDLWKKEIVNELINKKVDILVSYLPVGSKQASIFYAECALEAKVAFANAIPEFICSDETWNQRFEKVGIPCAGDDIKSQIGATIIHRALVDLINQRGHIIDNTYQLNVGGNTDFMNMTDEDRLISKRISKTEAVTSLIKEYSFDTRIGPSDFVSHLRDNKICYIQINGKQFGGVPFNIDVKLSVEDSPNSAGVMIDVIRLLKIAKDRGLAGYQDFSCYYFKHPMRQYSDNEGHKIVSNFIKNQ